MNDNIVLSISGGAGLFPASIGACYKIDEYIREIYPGKTIKYAGVSSGCLVALMLSLGMAEDENFKFYLRFVGFFDAWYKNPVTYWYVAVRKLIEAILREPDDYKRLNGRLHVGITRVRVGRKPEFVVVSEFKSNKHVVDTIIVSGTLFPLSWTPVRFYDGGLACDGGYVYNYVTLEDHYNVVFKYDHVTGVFGAWDWLISTSVDKWHRLFKGAQRHIRDREGEWKEIIRSKGNTRDIIRKGDRSNTLTYALRIMKWLILEGKGVKIFIFVVMVFMFWRRWKNLNKYKKFLVC
ncbi:MAG: hypothetical protein Hyperionvirus15_20 [Hyperionvirus sp.]|uniref:PNPLA domain-containing protein n=1 Tax=Hyperionvirus sp. TaxID=2487770 RepID=A0A3G5AA85_9VIRU|nr:MAG: hypothetical protein Hyperionvirus15_20 [Hyperionvirus sp.]